MNASELRVISDTVVKLTKLRQLHCNHLCVENYAPELFLKLLSAYKNSLEEITIAVDTTILPRVTTNRQDTESKKE